MTETQFLSIGKPVPIIVRMSPPRAFTALGVAEETTNAIEMSATPSAYGKSPLESLISAL